LESFIAQIAAFSLSAIHSWENVFAIVRNLIGSKRPWENELLEIVLTN
jgi:hypothetical protein